MDNAGYAADQALYGWNPELIVRKLIDEEIERNILNCLCVCLFARNVYDRPTIAKALKTIGLEWNEEKLGELGRKIFRMKRDLKGELGYRLENIRFPKRFFETRCLHGKMEEGKLRQLLNHYQTEYYSI